MSGAAITYPYRQNRDIDLMCLLGDSHRHRSSAPLTTVTHFIFQVLIFLLSCQQRFAYGRSVRYIDCCQLKGNIEILKSHNCFLLNA